MDVTPGTSSARNLRRAANTFESVTERFIRLQAKPNVKSWRNVERVIGLHVLLHWRDRVMRDIPRSGVHHLLDGLVETGEVGTAREAR